MRHNTLFGSTLIAAAVLVCSATSSFSQITSLPTPWSSQDIGNPAIPGSASLSSGVFTIEGTGSDIWGTSDQFFFAYQMMTGDGEVIARVDSITAANLWSKAGVMIRETLAPNSKHELALVSAGSGVALQRRTSAGGSSYSTAGTLSLAPRWVALVRRGSSFQAYESADGKTWQLIGSNLNTMASTVYVGLAVTSHNSSGLATSRFSNVNVHPVTANQPPTISLIEPASGATYTAPATIALAASASDVDGTISKVDFYNGTSWIGSRSSAPYSYSVSGISAGTYSITAVATDNLGARTTSAPRTVTVSDPSASVPAPWTAQDIGNPAVVGSATENGGTLTVSGAGADIWGTADQFQFVYQPLTGDGTVIARIESLTVVNAWSKAGVMMRETLSAGSKHASMFATGSNGMAFQRRPTTGATSLHTYGTATNAPYWVRVTRRGDVFEASDSSDGQTWRLVGSEPISMPPTIYVGLAVTSHDATRATTGVFSNVSATETTQNQAPAVSLTSPINGATFTAAATVTLAATASDSDGTVSRVDFYREGTLIGSDTTSPYSVSWPNVAAGTYILTAVATDNSGARTTSNAVSIAVAGATNIAPTVSVTSPTNGSSFSAPATILLTASAVDSDGIVSKVDFYVGATLVGTDTSSPYSFNWASGAPGKYSVTARATDNAGGVTTSSAVSVTLNPSQAVFSASVDDAIVTSYRLDIFLAGADPATAIPQASKDLGKPPVVSGQITVDVTATLQPLAAGSYFATVSAINVAGSSRSAPSNTFSR